MNLSLLVADSAGRTPAALAVAGPDGDHDYATLDALAAGFAERLAALGVGRGDRVVVHAARSARVVAAFQGVLRLGAVYVPVDGSAPPERAATVARDCTARVVCAEDDREVTAPATVLRLDDVLPTDPVPHVEVGPDDLAYLLYTSGSTGTPKGVRLTHRNARAFVAWAADELGATPADRFANHASFGFDLSVLDLYVPFLVGASVHLVPPDQATSPVALTAFLRDRGITVWYSVPSALMLMAGQGGLLDEPAPALRALLFAGEPFPIPYVRDLRRWTDARLLNLYGPTETNVCAFHEVRDEDLRRDRPVPIGRAASGDRLEVVTATGRSARPGDEGELVVSGPTVMPGYWGRGPAEDPYPTGDLVRVMDDGALDYVGRRDHMVKLRGHRVELGEIESTIVAHPDVEDAAVLVRGQAIEARLVAVVVPAGDARPGTIAIKGHSARTLPPYMVVDSVVRVPALPRTPNGKVDRAALTALLDDRDRADAPIPAGGPR